jgi:hypothetical protein
VTARSLIETELSAVIPHSSIFLRRSGRDIRRDSWIAKHLETAKTFKPQNAIFLNGSSSFCHEISRAYAARFAAQRYSGYVYRLNPVDSWFPHSWVISNENVIEPTLSGESVYWGVPIPLEIDFYLNKNSPWIAFERQMFADDFVNSKTFTNFADWKKSERSLHNDLSLPLCTSRRSNPLR